MFTPLFIGGIGPPEMLLIFLLVVLLFGAQKLPELARSSGQAMGEFQRGRNEIEDELRGATEDVTDDETETEVASEDVETDSSTKAA